MVLADPAPGKVIMDIGCNKGNDALKWMERWDTWGFFSTQKWIDTVNGMIAGGHGYACPVSGSCVTARQANKDMPEYPIGLCVEPMQANIDLLHKVSSALGYTANTQRGSFHIVQAAVMDKASPNATISFPDGEPGQETLGLEAFVQTDVPLRTVDMLAAEFALDRVDILTIDTEGADPAVLRGAVQTLRSVRYIEFEVARMKTNTEWEHHTLHSVVADLDAKGFDCYWAGNNAKLLSMNRCWDDSFERRVWANAACVKRGDPWSAVLQRFAKP